MDLQKPAGKILALDLGTRWVGIALSNSSQTFAHPYDTVQLGDLYTRLRTLFTREKPILTLVGHPITVTGGSSAQTRLVEQQFTSLQKHFPTMHWKLWDERFTSYAAQSLMSAQTTKARHTEHAIAAALFLQSYCDQLPHTPP